jgi:hypothetical protein
MEWPGSWTALVASVSVADFDDPDGMWQFLRAANLVVDAANGSEVLANVIAAETSRGRITGATLALRVANHLVHHGLARPEASADDPFATLAARRWAVFSGADGPKAPGLLNEEL